MVLRCKWIHRCCKTIRCHPRNWFYLWTNFLDSHRRISISRDQTCNDHRYSGKQHTLNRRWKTDSDNSFQMMQIRLLQISYILKKYGILHRKYKKHNCNDHLRDYRSNCCTCHSKNRKWSDSKNQNRIQDDINNQSGRCCQKYRPAVTDCRK